MYKADPWSLHWNFGNNSNRCQLWTYTANCFLVFSIFHNFQLKKKQWNSAQFRTNFNFFFSFFAFVHQNSTEMKNVFVLVSWFAVSISAKTALKQSQTTVETCGVSKVNTGYIVGGKSFSRGSFPWIVALTYTKSEPSKFFCGATLISSKFVTSGELKNKFLLGVKL